MKKYLLTLIASLSVIFNLVAQPIEMATKLRADGKIYTVVAVMLVIFLGVAIYLFTLDRRIKKIENN